MLTTDDIREYQAIYKKVLGKEITYEEAQEQSIKLTTLLETIFNSH